MAEAGSFADRVKQQADIVRVVGEYVRLKKSGQNFTGLCPFHSEKTPSFAVHPVKQIYHCFGCGVGGDVFKFIMEMDKSTFPDAVRTVAEKCGIAIPRAKERTPEERQQNQQRTSLVEMHREAAAFFAQQLNGSPEGRAAKAYLLDRGLDSDAMARFGIGFAPSGGEALLRTFKQKFPEKALEVSDLGKSVFAGPRAGLRCHGTLRHRLRAVRRRGPLAHVQAEISREGAGSFRSRQKRICWTAGWTPMPWHASASASRRQAERPSCARSSRNFQRRRWKFPISEKAYLLDRGLDSDAMARFGIGFAPSGGEALLRTFKQKFPEKALEVS